MANYAENMYQWLKRQGYSEVYERAGIYEITINGITAYIGKSTDMLWRLAQHYAALKLSKEHASFFHSSMEDRVVAQLQGGLVISLEDNQLVFGRIITKADSQRKRTGSRLLPITLITAQEYDTRTRLFQVISEEKVSHNAEHVKNS